MEQDSLNNSLSLAMLGGVSVSHVRELIRQGADVNARNHNGETPLYRAAYNGQAVFVDVLMQAGADINARFEHEKTVLHCAASRGQASVIPALIGAGADVNAQASGQSTPLLWAVLEVRLAAVKVLIDKGALVNARTTAGFTPLHVAAQIDPSSAGTFGRDAPEDVLSALIRAGADVNAQTEIVLATPLHFASYNLYANAIPMLLRAGADVNAQTNEQETSMHVMNFYGDEQPVIEVINALARGGADINARNKDGKTPLDIAVDKKCADIKIDALVKIGCKRGQDLD